MKIFCRTSLDLIAEVWPTKLPESPQIGDLIESKTKWGDFQLELQVCSRKWQCNGYGEYYLRVELHMTPWQKMLPGNKNPELGHTYEDGSLLAFYKWYASLTGKSMSAFI